MLTLKCNPGIFISVVSYQENEILCRVSSKTIFHVPANDIVEHTVMHFLFADKIHFALKWESVYLFISGVLT